ncbi:MAG: flippase-like domain-containing protein [Gammaproteobacteria bacterium]|jgi:hypothetical protein|nr:flippase-like domain-containing protein [Gammaproteobacteria bacterium]
MHLRFSIKVLVALGLMILLFSIVDTRQFLVAIRQADYWLVFWGFCIYSGLFLFESARLIIVFASFGVRVITALKLCLVGLFFGNFVPGSIGTDIYQVFYLQQIKSGLLAPISLSLFLRLTGLVLNVIFLILAYAMISYAQDFDISAQWPLDSWKYAGLGLIALVVLAFAALSIIRPSRIFASKLFTRIKQILLEVLEVLGSFSATHILNIMLLGSMVIFCRAFGIYILTLALGESISSAEAVFTVAVSALAMFLPITFAGLGVRELTVAAILVFFGVSPPAAAAVAILSRCYIWILSGVGGIWFVFDRYPSKS